MSKVRVVYRPDKSVVVIHPAFKSRRSDETEAEWLDRVFTKAMQGELEGLDFDDIDKSDLPTDRNDRNAWEGEKGKKVKVNAAKAKAIKDKKERDELILSKKENILLIEELEARVTALENR